MSEEQACAVPLIELLRGVPSDARLVIEEGPCHTRFIPVGRYCKEAAAALSAPAPHPVAPMGAWLPIVSAPEDEIVLVAAEFDCPGTKPQGDLPASYECSTLVSKGKGAAITFHFGSISEAIAWHEKLTTPAAALRAPGDGEGADTARLDWLIGQDNCVVSEGTNGFWLCWIDEYNPRGTEFQKGSFPTARAAIDAAIASQASATGN